MYYIYIYIYHFVIMSYNNNENNDYTHKDFEIVTLEKIIESNKIILSNNKLDWKKRKIPILWKYFPKNSYIAEKKRCYQRFIKACQKNNINIYNREFQIFITHMNNGITFPTPIEKFIDEQTEFGNMSESGSAQNIKRPKSKSQKKLNKSSITLPTQSLSNEPNPNISLNILEPEILESWEDNIFLK